MDLASGMILCFLFQIVVAQERCLECIATLRTVPSCPTTEDSLSKASKRKHCDSIANVQSSSNPGNFTYHCVLNSWKNATVEVCAKSIFSQGYCINFNEGGAQLQQLYKDDCTKFSQPCPPRFLSSDLLKYNQCNDIVKTNENTRTSSSKTTIYPSGTESTENNSCRTLKYMVIIFGVLLFVLIAGLFGYFCYRRTVKRKSAKKTDKRQSKTNEFNMNNTLEEKNLLGTDSSFNKFEGSRTQAFHEDCFFKTLKLYELEKVMDMLVDNGVDCLQTFCTLEDSDFKSFGLNTGQRTKCRLAALRIKEKGLSQTISTDDLEKAEQAEETKCYHICGMENCLQ